MKFILTARVILFSSCLVFLYGGKAWAQDFSLAGFEKLIIVAPQAQVNLLPGNATQIRIQPQSSLSWSAKEEGKTLRLTATFNPGVNRGGAPPKLDFNIPAVPLELHLIDGSVNVQRWTRPLLLDVQKGKINLKEVKTSVNAQLGQGQIHVLDQQGALQVDLYKGDLILKNAQGPVEVSNFQGALNFDQLNGPLKLEQAQGNAEILNSTGGVSFFAQKSGLAMKGYKGRVEGVSQEGNLNFQLQPEMDVQVKSGSGRVSLDSKNSGALLALTSEAGEIVGTRNLRPGKDRGAQVLRGRLKGSNGGRVEVFAERGNIVVKE